jgi:drug/metabolite transporter (DMT)-like permease
VPFHDADLFRGRRRLAVFGGSDEARLAGRERGSAGVALLLWHEITSLTGQPLGVALALAAAATWSLGTQLLRRTRMKCRRSPFHSGTVLTAAFMTTLAVLSERGDWQAPDGTVWAAILFNGVLIFGFAHATWFSLARALPPVASTLSVMLIPVVGVFSGALWLGEVLHWQDWAAVVLMVVAIASVLWPAAATPAPRAA